jgi:hypothetical protein
VACREAFGLSRNRFHTECILTRHAAIRIDNGDESEKGIALSNACSNGRPATGTKLVFQRLGDNYFLYQIWTEGSSLGREFPMSKTEVQLAKNYSKPKLVIVAANISHQPKNRPAVFIAKERPNGTQPFPLFVWDDSYFRARQVLSI